MYEIGLVEECLFCVKFFNCGLVEKNGFKNRFVSMVLFYCEVVCFVI